MFLTDLSLRKPSTILFLIVFGAVKLRITLLKKRELKSTRSRFVGNRSHDAIFSHYAFFKSVYARMLLEVKEILKSYSDSKVVIDVRLAWLAFDRRLSPHLLFYVLCVLERVLELRR